MGTSTTIVADFEAGTIDNTTFGHPDHVRVIWEFIHAYGTLEAVGRFEAGLKRITAAAGHPEKYHATITHAFAFLVGQRIAEQGAVSWPDFVETNPDLFDWPNSALSRMYPDDTLGTTTARRTFVMPLSLRNRVDSNPI
jgi:hypothetical protein